MLITQNYTTFLDNIVNLVARREQTESFVSLQQLNKNGRVIALCQNEQKAQCRRIWSINSILSREQKQNILKPFIQ